MHAGILYFCKHISILVIDQKFFPKKLTFGYFIVKKVSKFSDKLGSTPTNGFTTETPGSGTSGWSFVRLLFL